MERWNKTKGGGVKVVWGESLPGGNKRLRTSQRGKLLLDVSI